jgi:hypothetical protein
MFVDYWFLRQKAEKLLLHGYMARREEDFQRYTIVLRLME